MLLLGPLLAAAAPARGEPPPAPCAGRGPIGAPAVDRKRLLEEAQELVLWQRYRAAERLLVDASKKAADHAADAAAPDLEAALLTALGEVYLLGKLRVGPHRTTVRHRSLRRFRGAVAQGAGPAGGGRYFVVASLAGLGDSQQAVSTLKTMWARFQSQRRVDPVAQLELLAELSSLGAAARSHGTPLVLADEVHRLAERLAVDRRGGLVGTEDYARGLTSLAECQERSNEWRAGAETMQKVVRCAPTATKFWPRYRPPGGWRKSIGSMPTRPRKSKC